MAVERLSDPADSRVAAYRHTSDAELLTAHGLFVAEGRLVVRRLIEDGRYRIESLLVNDAALNSLEPLLAAIDDRVPIYLCETADFRFLTGYHVHRGCLALVERPPARSVAALLESLEAGRSCDAERGSVGSEAGSHRHRSPATLVVLEGVTNADNVGGVFRNAAAFGADAVLLSPACCDPLYRKAIRTSMAATLRVPYAWIEDWPDGLDDLRARGFAIVALTPRQPSVSLAAFAASPRPLRIALLVGTEGDGLTAGAEAAADTRLRIPIAPAVDSLNLAVAVGIALHQLAAGSR
jgi:tRNA G18 (ribose-2'-O)-methylase SpoU